MSGTPKPVRGERKILAEHRLCWGMAWQSPTLGGLRTKEGHPGCSCLCGMPSVAKREGMRFGRLQPSFPPVSPQEVPEDPVPGKRAVGRGALRPRGV